MKKKGCKAAIYVTLVMMAAAGFILYSVSILPENYYQTDGSNLNSVTAFPSVLSSSAEKQQNISKVNHYETQILLFGLIPVKRIGITVVPEKKLIPSGQSFGIKFFTEGVIVVGLSDIKTENGSENPAFAAGIRVRDVILAIDGSKVNTVEEVSSIVEKSEGRQLSLTIKRNNSNFEVKVAPKKPSRESSYRIGAWVRDSTAGIGTITYIDPFNNNFAALGHGICDVDTGDLLLLNKATVYTAQITGINKGERGKPGELRGVFLEDSQLGFLNINSQSGIFGKFDSTNNIEDAIPIAFKQDIAEGDAKILCTIDGIKPQYYSIQITKVYRNSTLYSKNMMIKVTDENLLSKTGGIIQGMSGSPIIQNGKIVGAVTHVLVNDPQRGFGIFIENMLEASGEYKKAA